MATEIEAIFGSDLQQRLETALLEGRAIARAEPDACTQPLTEYLLKHAATVLAGARLDDGDFVDLVDQLAEKFRSACVEEKTIQSRTSPRDSRPPKNPMRFEDIERALGLEIVAEVQHVIESASVAARGLAAPHDTALQELLIAMLVVIVVPDRDVIVTQQCLVELRQAVARSSGLKRPRLAH
jgi:hypothetical protein